MNKWLVKTAFLILVATGVGASSLAAIKAPEKPKEITVMMQFLGRLEEDRNKDFLDEFKRLTGIELHSMRYGPTYREKLVVTLASGNLPDVIQVGTDFVEMADQGVIQPIKAEWIRESPIFSQFEKQYIEAYRYKGQIWALPISEPPSKVLMIRKDWLDKLGLDVPKTWQEFYDAATAFATKDPDGNGKNDTVGLTFGASQEEGSAIGIEFIQNMFQKYAGDYYRDDLGRIRAAFFSPGYKEYLAYLRKGISDKAFDPEITTLKVAEAQRRLITGKAGIYAELQNVVDKTIVLAKQQNPKAEMAIVNFPAGPKGYKGYSQIMNSQAMALTVGCKNPYGVFKYYMEWVNTQQGLELLCYGPESKSWKMENGKFVRLQLDLHHGAYPNKVLNEDFKPLEPFNDYILQAQKVAKANGRMNNIRQLQDPLRSELDSLASEYYAMIISGEKDVDSGLREFQEKWEKKGGKNYLQELVEFNKR